MAPQSNPGHPTPDSARTYWHPSERSLRKLFAVAEDGFVQLRPLRDEHGEILDAEVVAWNHTFAVAVGIRLERRPTVGTRLSEYAYTFTLTLEHIAEAMTSGRSVQFLPGFDAAHYDDVGSRPQRLLWQRIDDSVIGQATDLTEYQRLQEQLADQRTLAALAVKARTLAEDRERIARNLHDSVIQRLYASALELEFLAMDGAPPADRNKLGAIGRDLQALVAEIRNEIFDVKHSIQSGLREEVLDVMMPMAQALGVSIEVETSVRAIEDAELAQHVRAVVREAASNAIRHGHASRLVVAISADNGLLVVTVTDNGVGIASDAGSSSGLDNLRRRAERFGGTLALRPGLGGGVELRWSVSIDAGKCETVGRATNAPAPPHHLSVELPSEESPDLRQRGGIGDPRLAVRRPRDRS